MQNIAAKKRAGQEDVDSYYLLANCFQFRARSTNHTANHVAGFAEPASRVVSDALTSHGIKMNLLGGKSGGG